MSTKGDGSPKLRTIRASEIGEYNYCTRAWWYRHVVKMAPTGAGAAERAGRLVVGREAHRRHGRAVALSGTLRTIGLLLGLLGLLALAAALVLRQ